MGYFGKLELKLKAQQLRKHGISVREIQRKLKVSRSSVSLWVRDIKLTKQQLQKLYQNKKTGGLKGSIIAAMNKVKARKKITQKLLEKGRKEVKRLSKRDRFIAGIALYFAEGNKVGNSVSFSNSDFRALKFMVDWLRNYCYVPEEKFRCSLYLHDNLNEGSAKRFWISLLKVPNSQFTKSYIVKSNHKRFRKTKHKNGVLRVTVSDVNLHRKIMGWISGVISV
ncbi:hypothetical protein A3A46_03725 [Candidatus Roizmanbacteria bacterium RIFCSPLOWO2_01_FULL_37_13]|uniref:Uncharacterized protein n=1 Tax=Candidatus Roizmanbacteria bacterium RIFCSPHIGHO2_02_FULL_38_11 TaxID=1802039 RepID=A0A1F7H2D5_9BACT|nr:MAG: hypothetical protein A3C25_00505 [Candidatus Roizmanbacteria bacterium RIFCSPHIGHO2_02_FULL_38_11]OGK41032.1 MAG: hypothetical protein A3A46_03725 [Candidatus Roizmanbacteria bacterium RIFCSPLOWO2_01_FULL_37_13]